MMPQSNSGSVLAESSVYGIFQKRGSEVRKFGVSTSFFLTFAAIFVAYSHPATGYELSIYRATPIGVWVLILGSFAILSIVLIRDLRNSVALSGIVLNMFVIILLPILRGWYFLGKEDSLKSWGLLVDISQDTPSLLFYLPDPGMELLAYAIHIVTGESMRYSLFLVPFPFVFLFVVSIGLILRRASTSPTGYAIGILSGLLLLPVNWQSVYILPHASSQATMYLGFTIYAVYLYYTADSKRMVAIFTIISPFLLILHPQITMDLILVLGFAWLIVLFFSKVDVSPRRTLFLCLIFGIPLGLWAINQNLFAFRVVEFIMLLSGDFGGKSLKKGSMTLSQKNLSIGTVFIRLFFVSIVFSLLAGAYGLLTFRGGSNLLPKGTRQRIGSSYNQVLNILVLSIPPVFLIFLVNLLVENNPAYYFRHLAVIMVFATLSGGMFIIYSLDKRTIWPEITTRDVTLFLLILLIISTPIIYPSPYIGKGSQHVTEKQVEGFNTMFRYENNDVYYLDLYSHAWRYYLVQHGYGKIKQGNGADLRSVREITKSDSKWSTMGKHFSNRTIGKRNGGSRYLTVTDADKKVELNLFNGARINNRDLDYLNTSHDIQQIYSNGGMDVYYV